MATIAIRNILATRQFPELINMTLLSLITWMLTVSVK